MRLLLLGADGQLGRELRATLAPLGEVHALGRGHDISDAAAMRAAIRDAQPDAIVNAAAYTAVDRAEAEPERAHAVNAAACGMLAAEAQARGAWLVHYSTDYVFDGSGTRPWREEDEARPLSVYGASKLAGERAIRAQCERHVIFRTSWVFSAHARNFLTAILGAARERDSLTVVDDQVGAPTSANLLAHVTARVLPSLGKSQAGLYHCAPSGFATRLEFATFALQCAVDAGLPLKAGPGAVRGVPTTAMPAPAQRPLNSRLDTKRLRETFGIQLPPWEDDVRAAVAAFAASAMGK